MIQDPTDPKQAIAPSGRLAGQVYFAPVGTDPTDESAWTFIGFADPDQIIPKETR